MGGCLCLCLSLLPLSLSLSIMRHTQKIIKKHFLLQFDTQSSCLHTHTQAETDRLYITHCVAIDTFVSMYVSHELSMHTHQYLTVHIGERERETTSNIKSGEGRGVEKAVIYCALSCCCSCSCCLSASVSLCVCVRVCWQDEAAARVAEAAAEAEAEYRITSADAFSRGSGRAERQSSDEEPSKAHKST